MDIDAIIEALSKKTSERIAAGVGPLHDAMQGMVKAKADSDAHIAQLEEKIGAMQKLLDQQDERMTLALGEILREGVEVAQKQVRETLAAIPVPTYKGVFDRDADYSAGDMVTYKGSVWHCNANLSTFANNLEAPGKGDAWTLAVKCGRDGRDAKAEADE